MRVVKIFTEVSMSKQHKGLLEILRRNKVDPAKLNGVLLLFMNKTCNKIKCLSPNMVLSYIKLNTGTVSTEVIQEFARAFDENGRISFNAETLAALNAQVEGVEPQARPIRASILRKKQTFANPALYAGS